MLVFTGHFRFVEGQLGCERQIMLHFFAQHCLGDSRQVETTFNLDRGGPASIQKQVLQFNDLHCWPSGSTARMQGEKYLKSVCCPGIYAVLSA